jgi:hypothetical protein
LPASGKTASAQLRLRSHREGRASRRRALKLESAVPPQAIIRAALASLRPEALLPLPAES